MTRKLTKFSQTELAQFKGLTSGGYCLALSSYWSKLIIASGKDRWAVPTETVENRLKALKDNAVELHKTHKKYTDRQSHVKATARKQEALIMVARSGFMDDRADLIQFLREDQKDAVEFSIVTVNGIGLQKSALLLMKSLGVPAVNAKTITVGSAEAAKTITSTEVEKGAVYVITPLHGTTSSEHAMAIYRSSGVFSTYFYIFDPNFGEVFASDSDEAAFVVNKFMGTASPYKTTQWNLLRCN